MRAGRTAVSSLVAGALALSLVAAESAPAPTSSGTASTRLVGAEATVTGPFATPLTRILDVDTSATTEATPLATTSVVPIELADGTTIGEAGASSDGQASDDSDGGALTDLGGALDLAVSPIETSATASADRALATVGAATARLDALLGTLGLDLTTAGVTSLVTRDGASATQGLQVSGLTLDLAALGLDADVLATLGLENILDLLAALPGLLPSELPDVTAILDQLDELDVALAALPDVAAPAQDSLDQLVLIHTVLPEVETLDGLLTTLTALLDLSVTDLLAELTTNADLTAALVDAGCQLSGGTLDSSNVEAALDGAIQCVVDALTGMRDELVAGGVAGLEGVAAADLRATLTGLGDALLAALPGELDAVVTHLDELIVLVGDILTLVEDLEALLGQLPGLLEDAAALDLLSVGAFDVGTSAVAGDSVADSAAAVLCDAVDVTVLGDSFATPDCSEALDDLPDVTGAIAAAVGELAGVLNTLPLADLVEVGELRADVFTDVVEQVTSTDGVVTSTAGFDLLDLAVPSVTLDPSQVTSTLDGLELPDVLGPTEAAQVDLTDLSDQLGVLGGLGVDVTEPTAIVTGAQDDLSVLTSLVTEDLPVLFERVLGLADVLGLGTLVDEIRTPGLTLLVDQTSTATFQAVASDGTAAPAPEPTTPAPDPAPAPTPTPAPEPTLPSTGGGLALMGLLSLAAAASLRRRR